VQVSDVFVGTTVFCKWTVPAGNPTGNTTTGASINGTFIHCTTPSTLYAGDWLVEILLDGVVFTNAKVMSVYSTSK